MTKPKIDAERKVVTLDARKVFRLFDRPVQPVTDQNN